MMTNHFDLTGKVALVTGGSRGLGYQMVKAFADHGADVFITSRKLETCDKVAGEVRAMGRKAATYACNVANWPELDGMVEAAYAAFGKIDAPYRARSASNGTHCVDSVITRVLSSVASTFSTAENRADQPEISGSKTRVSANSASCAVAGVPSWNVVSRILKV